MASPRNLALFENHRWEDTPLGPVDRWPAAMRATVRTVLSSGMPMATAWGPHRVQIYNDGYNAIYGDKHPAAFGAPAAECWGEIWSFLAPAIDTIFDSGNTLNFENTLLALSKHGPPEECYFDFSYSPVFDEDGRVLGFLSAAVETTARIVTARRQAVFDAIASLRPATGDVADFLGGLREALASNQDDAASAALYSVDPASGLPDRLLWSLRADDVLLAALHEAARGHRLAPDLRTPSPAAVAVASGGGPRQAGLLPVHRRDGSPVALLLLTHGPYVPWSSSHRPFCLALSERLHVALHDFEAREMQLRSLTMSLDEKQQLYQFLFDNIVDGAIYAVSTVTDDPPETVLAANRQACAMLGYDEREIVGLRREQLVFDDGGTLSAAVRRREKTGEFVGELRFRHRDGRPILVEVASRLVTTERGDIRSVTLVRDISARKALERRHLQEVRAETMSQMSAGIAHDFNNLLTVIVGGVDLMRGRFEAGTVEAQVMAAMQQAADKAASLTRELLSFTGVQNVQAHLADIAALVIETEQMLRGAIGDSIRLELRLAPDLPHCLVDPALFSTALLNLALNARDAMPEGGVVTIAADLFKPLDLEPAHSVPPAMDRPHVRLTVSDTGHGIPAELLERIFDPFFTTKQTGLGSGLGLPMVLAFARKSGGFVRVASEPGRGARFELLLPAVEAADSPPGLPRTVPGTGASGQTVLVVEDNDLVRMQAMRMLTDAGFRCIPAPDGQKALSILSTDMTIGIVFTDVMMPGMSGRRLADEVHRQRPGLPILLTTGYDGEIREQAELAGARYEVLPKPYTRGELVSAVLRQFEAARRSPPFEPR
ncbi:ATP-binding protein [Zeimonas arvi]|uniref:histidine kinase n=1 Tax=Zeimonas arvi TaxID=2498847 RepID=A0A5C8P5Z8_9BURK|nr:PAS domain-containing sensor histidine kinase [Zeimonas arvi]TXL68733.1 response regulator [Zeimonas arvi]